MSASPKRKRRDDRERPKLNLLEACEAYLINRYYIFFIDILRDLYLSSAAIFAHMLE